MRKIKKAIIPAAGLGTRFLPATKTIPKEMLPIVDRPSLLYIVEEATRAGIEDIIIIAGRNKTAIEDFFDVSFELEDKLMKDGKADGLKTLKDIRSLANIISIRQKQPLGLGHAVLCGRPVVGDEPFAVLLGDEIMISEPGEPTVTEQLTKIWDRTGLSTVAVMPVPESDLSKYGILEGEQRPDGTLKATRLIEKPTASQTKSRWALPGRYTFDSAIFDMIANAKPGKNGEIQLTDSMQILAQTKGLLATEFEARRFDTGDKFGFLHANFELALERPDLGGPLRDYIINKAQEFARSMK
jgi:UTP--glucose-1-phosphate uridylyltransferase